MGVPLESGIRKEEYVALLRDALFGEQGDRVQDAGEGTQPDLTHSHAQPPALHSSGVVGIRSEYRVLELQSRRDEIRLQQVQL